MNDKFRFHCVYDDESDFDTPFHVVSLQRKIPATQRWKGRGASLLREHQTMHKTILTRWNEPTWTKSVPSFSRRITRVYLPYISVFSVDHLLYADQFATVTRAFLVRNRTFLEEEARMREWQFIGMLTWLHTLPWIGTSSASRSEAALSMWKRRGITRRSYFSDAYTKMETRNSHYITHITGLFRTRITTLRRMCQSQSLEKKKTARNLTIEFHFFAFPL